MFGRPKLYIYFNSNSCESQAKEFKNFKLEKTKELCLNIIIYILFLNKHNSCE